MFKTSDLPLADFVKSVVKRIDPTLSITTYLTVEDVAKIGISYWEGAHAASAGLTKADSPYDSDLCISWEEGFDAETARRTLDGYRKLSNGEQ